MDEENISQEFRLDNTYEIKNYFIEEINQNELLGKKDKKVPTIFSYIEHFLVLVSVITGCVSTSAVTSLVGIPTGFTSFRGRIKSCAITAGIKY